MLNLSTPIQAGARNIRVILNVEQKCKRKSFRVSEIYVCDDGCGMDPQLLTRCLGISESEQNNEDGTVTRWGLIGSTL